MNESGDIAGIIAALALLILGLLFAIPSPLDLAVMIAEAFRSAMPNGAQMLETWILALRILGWSLIVVDIFAILAFVRSKS